MGKDLMVKKEYALPVKLEDLAKFVLVGREKLIAVRAEIRAINKLGLAAGVRNQKKDEAQLLAGALLDAEVRIGDLLGKTEKEKGKRSDRPGNSAMTKLQKTGFTKNQSSQFQKLSDHKDLVKQVKQEAKENDDLPTRTEVLRKIKESKQEENRKIKENIKLPKGLYDVIYADPPWKYNNSGFEMSAEKKYPVLNLDEIKNYKDEVGRKITDTFSKDAILFLWTTNPILEDALKVLNYWGFKYKTNFVWIKKRHTAGFYIFGQHEILLIGIKGSMLPTGKKPKSIIYGENKKHSKKPEIVYEIIEEMFPKRKYLECFGRNKRKNWTVFGNQI